MNASRRDGRPLNRVPLGLREGRLYFVNEVTSGLACGCVCPSCDAPLVARNRPHPDRRRRPHFSHHTKGQCSGAFESAIHRAAKDALLQGALTLPHMHLAEPLQHQAVIIAAAKEKDAPGLTLTPDVVAEVEINGRSFNLLIEVRYRHAVEEEKRRAYREADLACIEIDVSDVDLDLFAERGLFEERVRDGARFGRWVSVNEAAVLALLGRSGCRVDQASFKLCEVPFTMRNGSPGAWLVKEQSVWMKWDTGWEQRSIELEQCRQPDGRWTDSGGISLPYPPGWYVRGSSSAFKTRLVPVTVAWEFPGSQPALALAEVESTGTESGLFRSDLFSA